MLAEMKKIVEGDHTGLMHQITGNWAQRVTCGRGWHRHQRKCRKLQDTVGGHLHWPYTGDVRSVGGDVPNFRIIRKG